MPPPHSPPRRWRPAIALLAVAAVARLAQGQSLAPGDGALRADPALASQADAPDPSTSPPPKKKRRKAQASTLPPLQIAPGAQHLGLRGGPPPWTPQATPGPTIAAIPAPPPPRRRPVDERPFDPVGVDVGDIRLFPYVEEDVGFSSNPRSLSTGAKASGFETTEAGLSFLSQWSRDDLHGQLRAGYTDYFNQSAANAPFANGSVGGRLDVTKDASLDAEARFNLTTQTPGSVTLPSGAILGTSARPLVTTFGGTLGGTQSFGDLRLSLHGTLDHTAYQDATLADGSVDKLSSDDFSDFGLKARAAYQASPVVAPFVEADADLRRYDASLDANGFARNSRGGAALAGLELSLSRQLTGEIDAGYGQRHYQDARLSDLRGPMIDAALIWSATPLTTVTLKASSRLADTTTPGVSGAVQRSYTIGVSHALLRNLTLGADAGLTTNAYSGNGGHDQTIDFGLKAEYDLNRNVVVKASATRSQFTTSLPGGNYVGNVFLLGLRFQQ